MDYIYLVEMNDEQVFESKDKKEAYDFINKEYKDTINYLKYETYNLGQLEVWENKILIIRLIEKRKGIFNTYKLLDNHNTKEKIEKTKKVKIVSNIMTPKRTRIKKDRKNKKSNMEKAEKGKKFKDENNETWVAKKGRDGVYKWEKHHQKTYDSKKNSKRKCPEDPAKMFDVGIKKKGMDNNFWVVKKDKNGNKKWMKF
tara:strand:+ start:1288 stop:1884 length:597 start_codon:yes stop_codon:yes gene_type:complete